MARALPLWPGLALSAVVTIAALLAMTEGLGAVFAVRLVRGSMQVS